MAKNTDAEIGQFLYTLSEAFPGQVKTSTLSVYLEELKDRLREVDLKVVKSKLISDCEFFPPVKRILEVVKHRREVERAQEQKQLLEPDPKATYSNGPQEFFKAHGVSNFAEYLAKQAKRGS